MRKTWRAILVVVAALLPAAAHAQPDVTARGAIIVDADTGVAIWEQNPDEPLPPASTTKVMTAVLALQSHRLDQEFPVSANAAATPPSKIGLRPGQSVALRDLLYAVLLKSANDAAVVVAEGVSGSEIQFADQMNLKARVVGATTTNFVNPHGLTEYGHVTTARDLSRIFRYGLGVPGFREVLSTTSAEVEIDGPDARLATVRSHNRLLNAPDYQVIGKTGYTRPARRCFVGAAGHSPREVVIAILGSSDLWGDARRMLDYGLRPDRPTPVLMASATPPPPAAELRAAPVAAVARAEPAAELRAAPPRAEPERPAAFARAEPTAAVERAARMARAQGVESETVLDDDESIAPSQAEVAPPAEEPQQLAAPPAPVDHGRRRRPTREDLSHPDLDREPAPEIVVPAHHEVPAAEERVQPAIVEEAPPPAAVAPQPVAAPRAPRPAVVEEPRPAAAAVEEPEQPGAGARDEITEPAAVQDREADRQPAGEPGPSLWADSPLREQGEGSRPRTTRPAREVERERSTPATVARGVTEPSRKTTRAEAQTGKRAQTARERRETANVTETGRRKPTADDVRRKRSTESTRVAARDVRRQTEPSRDSRPDRRRTAAARDDRDDDRRQQVVLTRASAMESRPARMTAKGFEADRSRTSKTARTGKRTDTEVADVSGKYTVQVGPYRDRKAVATARADLAKRGYEARVVGQTLELGNFAERKRAARLATQLRVNGHPATSAAARAR